MKLLRSAIQHRAPRRLNATHRASVVLIFHVRPDDVALLLIRRAEHASDPWSGHMGLPGGHRREDDVDDLRTALRETHEEIGLKLDDVGECLGALDDMRASARGHTLDLIITPFAYQVGASPSLTLGDEVAEVMWVSLTDIANGNHFICHRVDFGGRVAVLPGWQVEDRVVWGLTYRMVADLLRRAFS
jgi:8-oxo-dGTP pyrophosphatase MutT (NUDIX family)